MAALYFFRLVTFGRYIPQSPQFFRSLARKSPRSYLTLRSVIVRYVLYGASDHLETRLRPARLAAAAAVFGIRPAENFLHHRHDYLQRQSGRHLSGSTAIATSGIHPRQHRKRLRNAPPASFPTDRAGHGRTQKVDRPPGTTSRRNPRPR